MNVEKDKVKIKLWKMWLNVVEICKLVFVERDKIIYVCICKCNYFVVFKYFIYKVKGWKGGIFCII